MLSIGFVRSQTPLESSHEPELSLILSSVLTVCSAGAAVCDVDEEEG